MPNQSDSLMLKLLLVFLGAVVLIILIANILSQDTATIVGNYLYIPIQVSLLTMSILAVRYFGLDGIHGLGWLAFLGFAFCWFAGDMTWLVIEMVLEEPPYPSVADLFYLPGYPFLLIFAVSYIMPFRDAISKKIVLISSGIASALVIISIGMIGISDITFGDTISLSYPIADGIILIPVLSGLFIFFKTRQNIMWSLMLFGILATFVGDVLFSFFEYNNTYYTGHFMEIAFYWAYLLMTFGVIYHKKTITSLGKNGT